MGARVGTSDSATIRIGIIGTGMMGCEHIRNIVALDGAVVSAFSDPNEQSHQWARDNITGGSVGSSGPSAQGFSDHQDLLNSGAVDAVIVASPNFTHASILRDVLATDLPCLVEKPMCTTIEDCLDVVEAAGRRPALTWVGLEYRYMSPIAKLTQMVHEGEIGDVKMIAIREHRFPFLKKVDDWNRFTRNTGGTLVEKCCHFFDLMNLVSRAQPVRVYASGGQDVNHLDEVYAAGKPDILDNAFVIVDYDSGVRASLDLCMFAEASRNEQEISVVGTLGKVETALPGDGHVHLGRRDDRSVTSHASPIDPSVTHVGFHFGASYLEVAKFCDAIRNGSPADVTVTDGLRSVMIGVAAHRSIDQGRPVAISELL